MCYLFRHGWRRIHALSLFVEHILLGIEDVEKNLKPLVLEHTRLLAEVSQLLNPCLQILFLLLIVWN